MVFTDVDASYGNRTIRYVIKTADQVDKAGFCTSGTADDPYGLAGADREIDILQNGFLTVFLIAEIYMIEDDTSVWDICYRILRICDVSSIIDDFRNTLCAGNTHCYHNKNHGKHHKAHENVHAVGEKAHKLTGSKGAAYDHFGAEPADPQDTGINGKLHQGHVHDNDLLST